MNLIDAIKGQITPDVIGQLAGLVGASEDKTRSATHAVIPALLQGLAGVASRPGGGDKLAEAMGGLDLNMLGNLAGLLGGNKASSVLDQGTGLLSSLFGANTLASLISTLASFLGLDSATTKKLVGYLAPILMGLVAKNVMGGGTGSPNVNAIANLFTQQRDNILGAMPRGLSLSDIPNFLAANMGGAGRAAESVARSVASTAAAEGPSLGRLIPWLLLPLAALALWWWWSSRPVDSTSIPNQTSTPTRPLPPEIGMEGVVGKLSGQMTTWFKDLETTLGSVTDDASATAAVTKLKEMGTALEAVKTDIGNLPTDGRNALNLLIKNSLAALKATVDKLMDNPAIKAILDPVVSPMFKTLESLAV
jgi:hypothetical protein